jgi:type I restriction enzyme S subunit
MSDWENHTLADVGVTLIDCIHKTPPEAVRGFPYVMIPQLQNGRINLDNVRLISEEHYLEWTQKVKPQANDVILSRRCNPGVTAVVDEGLECALGQNLVLLRTDGKRLFPQFLRWLCRGSLWWEQVAAFLNVGSTFDSLRCADIPKFVLPIPPLPEQRAIASVLSSLDDKIDLLHRQNKTLEAMAETLFRQWFVEEAGEDWEIRRLSEIAHFLNGLACQKYPPKDPTDQLPVLKIKELTSGISDNSDIASRSVKQDYIIEAGDIIFSWSASLLVKLWDGECCVLNQHLFKVTSSEFPKWFVFLWCKYHLNEFIAISRAHATTMGHIKRGDLDNAKVAVPPDTDLKQMTNSMSPLLQKFEANNRQIRTLEKLRDTLLPKLMSGEVRVQYE